MAVRNRGRTMIAPRLGRGPVIPPGTPLYCMAPHPDARKHAEGEYPAVAPHMVRLPATLGVPVRRTFRVLDDFAVVPPGCFGVRCACGAVNEFEEVRGG